MSSHTLTLLATYWRRTLPSQAVHNNGKQTVQHPEECQRCRDETLALSPTTAFCTIVLSLFFPLVLPIATVMGSAASTVTVPKSALVTSLHRHNAQLLLVKKNIEQRLAKWFHCCGASSLLGRLPDDEVINEIIPSMFLICMLLATSALPRSLTWPSSPTWPPRFPAAFLPFSSVVHHLSSNHFQVFRLVLGPRVDCGSACDPLS